MFKFVVDAMGGDNGSGIIVEAVKSFLDKNPDCKITVVGDKKELLSLTDICEIIHAPEIVPMEAGALEVMRMKNASMNVAIKYFKEHNFDAVISCGSTGGFLSTATINLKLIPGVKRAALLSPFPTKIKGKKVVILDIGASNENSSDELAQFALIGSLYYKFVFDKKIPNVYLLSNGSEEGKGSPVIKETYKLLKESNFKGFCGNIEARDALNGEADVIVTDGFTGNVFLKTAEGTAKMMGSMVKDMLKKNLWTKIGALHLLSGIKNLKETMDYKSTGGALLLGVNGIVVKAHGSSDAFCFESALNVAKRLALNNVVNKIKEGLSNE